MGTAGQTMGTTGQTNCIAKQTNGEVDQINTFLSDDRCQYFHSGSIIPAHGGTISTANSGRAKPVWRNSTKYVHIRPVHNCKIKDTQIGGIRSRLSSLS